MRSCKDEEVAAVGVPPHHYLIKCHSWLAQDGCFRSVSLVIETIKHGRFIRWETFFGIILGHLLICCNDLV